MKLLNLYGKSSLGWQSFIYVTDGYGVYPRFINDCDHLVLKTYMRSVEGENTRPLTLFSSESNERHSAILNP